MKKILSYSVFNDPNIKMRKPNNHYIRCAIKNIYIARHYYPDWIIRYYVDETTVSENVIKYFREQDIEVITKKYNDSFPPICWRFLSLNEPNAVVLVRDIDLFPTLCEKLCVNEWINSDYKFNVIRFYEGMAIHVPAGMFGVKNAGKAFDIETDFFKWMKDNEEMKERREKTPPSCFYQPDEFKEKTKYLYGGFFVDQPFLRDFLWKQYGKEFMCHEKNCNLSIAEEQRRPLPLENFYDKDNEGVENIENKYKKQYQVDIKLLGIHR
jgi:hypothetical protein